MITHDEVRKTLNKTELGESPTRLMERKLLIHYYVDQQQKKDELLGLYKEKIQLLLDNVYVARPYIELDIRIEQLEKELEELE